MGALETAIWRDEYRATYIVHAEYSEPDMNVSAALKKMPRDIFDAQKNLSAIEFHSSNPIIFDSADSGDDSITRYLAFSLPTGRYEVASREYQPDPATMFGVSKFIEK